VDKVRIAIAQINTIVGDLKGNTDKILFCINKAVGDNVDLIVFPELAVTGYPPEDLLLKPHFIEENSRCARKIAEAVKNTIVIVGFSGSGKGRIYNSAGIFSNKKIAYIYNKINLPNYGVFDEKRYFNPGSGNALIKALDFSFAVNICEDIWVRETAAEKELFMRSGFFVNISASPYCLGKIKQREKILSDKAGKYSTPIIYCNLIGGQDELVFDGRSAVFDKNGKILAGAWAFEEDFLVVDLPVPEKKVTGKNSRVVKLDYRSKENPDRSVPRKTKSLNATEEVYSALTLGVRDYVRKNNFSRAVFGMSGGIDSALVACIAADALGRTNVLAVSMPSQYSSKETQADAEKISGNLGIGFSKIYIEDILDSYKLALESHFAGMDPDITEENLQARIRGNLLMAFSNKFRYLVLNTGNKSETSVGYCTLYGDMAGGFAVIKDIPKNMVYDLAEYRNRKEGKEIIPKSVIERAPSAELRPGQTDQDTLPPYEFLDEIIDLYVEKDMSFKGIVKKTGDEDIVRKILKLIDMNEYKRRQSPPGIKITPRAFGRDRRMPITNRYGGGV
jgi:NAD+ synthase (glutamine-hydrolysing)